MEALQSYCSTAFLPPTERQLWTTHGAIQWLSEWLSSTLDMDHWKQPETMT